MTKKVAVCIRDFPRTDQGGVVSVGEEFDINPHGYIYFDPGVCWMAGLFPHFFRIEEREVGPWRPKQGDFFWYINDNLYVCQSVHRTYGQLDSSRTIEIGNCFRTKEEAEARVPDVRNALNGRTLKQVLGQVIQGFPKCNLEEFRIKLLNEWEKDHQV